MTTSSSAQHDAQGDFDTGPLSWVMGEIRETLNRSKAAIHEAVAQDVEAQQTSIRVAKSYLHQAHGALQIVDVDGIALITETVEDLLDRVEAGQLPLTQDLAQSIVGAYQALAEYLDELLSGVPHRPVRLFPYYRALLEARGAERIHPADLFFPNLGIRPQLPAGESARSAKPEHYLLLRSQFEKALLPFLKGVARDAELASAAAMRDLIGEIEQAQNGQQARAFWWVMHGLAEAVAAGQIPNEVYVKQLFARINLQIRRLSQGSSSVAERLLRDALFFIARASDASPRARRIRDAYQLDGLVPDDYDHKRYGQVDIDALAAAKERLSLAKSVWNRIAGGDASVTESFEQEMHMLANAGTKLNSAPLSKLLRELRGIARHAAHGQPGDALGLEMATSLLFVENALNEIGRLPGNFAERAEAMTARLLAVVAGEKPVQSAQWLDDISREAQQRQTMAALAGEMQNSLRQVEKMLDEYFRDPSQRTPLDQLDAILHQIEGALAVLDQDDAMRTIRHTRKAVRRFLEADEEDAPELHEFQQVAQNVGALSFFIETLQLQADNAKNRFFFDEGSGTFRANLIEKNTVPGTPVDVPVAPDEVSETAPADTPAPLMPTVEDELAFHQQHSVELAISLTAEPDNQALQEQLKESLEKIRLDAALVDNPDANDRAQAGIDILERPDFSASREALAEIITATVPAISASAPLPPVVAPATDEAIDAELLDIFLSEAEEVLAAVRQTLPESRNQPYNQEHLTTLRRSFHTLKGSGRMVGLVTFGEAAWSVEQVLNLLLSEARSGDAELYALLDKAVEVLGAWVQDLKSSGRSDRTSHALVAAAERVKAGGQFVFEEVVEPIEVGPDLPPPALPEAEEISLSDADLAMFDASKEAPHTGTPEAEPVVSIADVIEFPTLNVHEFKQSDNVKRIGELELSVPLYSIYVAETDELVRRLSHDIDEWRHEPGRQADIHAVHAAHSLAGSSATVGCKAVQEAAHALELVLQHLARTPVRLTEHDYDTLEHSVERLKLMLQKFALGEMPVYQPEYARLLNSLRQDLEARADTHTAASWADPDISSPSFIEGKSTPQALAEPVLLNQEDTSADSLLTPRDELDADLLPVFLEEGRDLLPEAGSCLRSWQQELANSALPQSMLRLLHTLKGSARMAGAMALGQHLHDMETRIETIMRLGVSPAPAVEDLLIRYDQALHMFERLRNPHAGTPTPPTQEAGEMPVAAAHGAATSTQLTPVHVARPVPVRTTTSGSAVPAAPAPLVRVRADILDRLVNQAGEVSISRSKLETEVGTLKQSLSELTENVVRLRDQLREIEMQAETQITSRMANSSDREFDPLEFDRFTRLQELTRMMAESVNDVGSVHQNLNRTLETAIGDLSMQARLTRELQQDLMRVRMVQFASISERLYHVTRQAAKEVDKRVNLDIRGSAVEIDRGVLEKMAGPFEHLLRNAIVHGIESREERRAAGKSEAGELLVEIRQEGNEVVMQFSDDGRGLDLRRIRDKARNIGLLTGGDDLSDEEAADLIFHPGFSTAEEITELAGRGIGMDVVRSEAAALGGRVSTWSAPGKGTHFTVHLPLTLAVTQVVLLTTGGRTYAVPSVLVEQVQQLKTVALVAAYNEGSVVWQGQRVAMHYLPALLGDTAASPVSQQYSPVMVLKSGNDRVAIHVDEIIGNREVVVKNIGPQLARLAGIAGATVLGSGDIVLILNPMPLALRAAHDNIRAPRITASDVPAAMGAVAEAEAAVPVQGLRKQSIVMVVDDSLTVRRVTQRLLVREGYQVILAKDGVDALERLQSVTPDVMLVDIEMPRMDGFDLTRNVRNDERTRRIPIIMITSRTAAKHRNYALELGINEYLGKPYQEEQLLGLIAGFVGKTS